MEDGLPADLVGPFVLRAAKAEQPRWEALVRRCLDDDRLRGLGVYAAATHPAPPPGLLSMALDAAGDYPQNVDTWCLREEVPPATLLQMFCSTDARLAVAAAIGHWCGRAIRRAGNEAKRTCSYCGAEVAAEAVVCCMCLRILNMEEYKRFHFADGGIEDGRRLYDSWRQAILRAPADAAEISQHDEYWLGKILSKNGRLAEEWLISKFGRRDGDAGSWRVEGIAVEVVSVLDAAQSGQDSGGTALGLPCREAGEGVLWPLTLICIENCSRGANLPSTTSLRLPASQVRVGAEWFCSLYGKGHSVDDIVHCHLGAFLYLDRTREQDVGGLETSVRKAAR